jgi:hypothetical protein
LSAFVCRTTAIFDVIACKDQEVDAVVNSGAGWPRILVDLRLAAANSRRD